MRMPWPRWFLTLTLVAAFAMLTLAGCAIQHWYPNGAYGVGMENAYLSSCELRGSRTYCICTLGWLEANVSAAQIKSDEQNMLKGWPAPTYMTTAASACQWSA